MNQQQRKHLLERIKKETKIFLNVLKEDCQVSTKYGFDYENFIKDVKSGKLKFLKKTNNFSDKNHIYYSQRAEPAGQIPLRELFAIEDLNKYFVMPEFDQDRYDEIADKVYKAQNDMSDLIILGDSKDALSALNTYQKTLQGFANTIQKEAYETKTN